MNEDFLHPFRAIKHALLQCQCPNALQARENIRTPSRKRDEVVYIGSLKCDHSFAPDNIVYRDHFYQAFT